MVWLDASVTSWSHPLMKSGSGATTSAPARSCVREAKAGSISPSVPAFRIGRRTPFASAASCTPRTKGSTFGLFGFTSRAMTLA